MIPRRLLLLSLFIPAAALAVLPPNQWLVERTDGNGKAVTRALTLTNDGFVDLDGSGNFRTNRTAAQMRAKLGLGPGDALVIGSVNGLSITGGGILSVASGKTFEVNQSMTLTSVVSGATLNIASGGTLGSAAFTAASAYDAAGAAASAQAAGATDATTKANAAQAAAIGTAAADATTKANAAQAAAISAAATDATTKVATETTRATGIEVGLNTRLTTAEGTVATNSSAISALNATVVGALSPANTLGTITTLNQALTTPSGNSGKGYPIAISGTLSGTNAPAVAVVVGGTVVSNGTVYNYYPPSNIPADASVARAKLDSTVGASTDAAADIRAAAFRNPKSYGASLPFGAGTGGTGSGSGTTTWMQRDYIVTASGSLSFLTVKIGSVSTTPTMEICIVRPGAGANDFTVKQRATVSVPSTGTITWTPAQYGALTLAAGDKVAVRGINCGFQYNTTGAVNRYWSIATALTTDVEATWTLSGSNLDFYINFGVANAALGVERAEVGPALTTELDKSAIVAGLVTGDGAFNGDVTTTPSGSGGAASVLFQKDTLDGVSGDIASIYANVATVGASPSITWWLMRPDQTNALSWKPVASTTVSVVGTGVQSFAIPAATLPKLAGDRLGWTANNVTLRFFTTGATQFYVCGTSGALTIGSFYTFSLSGPATFEFGFSLRNKSVVVPEAILSASVQAKLNSPIAQTALDTYQASLGTTELTSTIFTSSAPAGWTMLGSGWSNTTAGLMTPDMAGINFAVQAGRYTELFNVNRELGVYRGVPQASGSRIAFGFEKASFISGGAAGQGGTAIQIDDVNHLLKLHGNFFSLSGTTEPPILASAALAPLTAGREYIITLKRNLDQLTFAVTDAMTGVVAGSLVFNDNVTGYSGTPGGAFGDGARIWPMTGQWLIKQYSLTCPVRSPFAVFTGDSTTAGVYTIPSLAWANMAVAALGGKALNIARGGSNFTKYQGDIGSTLPALKPKWIIVGSGFNDSSNTTAFNAMVDAYKAWADANDAKVAVMVQWHLLSGDNMSAMINAMLARRDVRLIRGDIAMSTGDGVTPDATKFVDQLHQNSPVGQAALFNRLKLDLPELFAQ